MAKSYRIVKLVSEEDTGYYYTATKSTRGLKAGVKLRFRKYDPVIRKHCWFKEVRKLK
jgi:large subunit ribosomal protein L33